MMLGALLKATDGTISLDGVEFSALSKADCPTSGCGTSGSSSRISTSCRR